MKNKLPKYDNYKHSNVEWLGEIPQHWEVKKLKSLSKIVNGATPSSGILSYWDGNIIWVTPTDINNIKIIEFSERTITEKGFQSCGTSLVPKGSIILTTRAPIGKLVIAGVELCTNQGCKSIIIDKINISNSFIYFLLSISNAKLNSLGTGTTFMELSNKELKSFLLPIPPLSEQEKIAQFLDEKTTKIDKAIEIKQRQIELLKERRQILIHRAVTRGLHENVPLKESGVEWIGEIPEHWEVKKTKFLFDEINERSKTGAEELLSVSHLTGVTPRSEKNVTMFLSEDYTDSKLCQKDDLVFNIMWAWMGALGVSDRTGIVSPSYAIYRQKNKDFFNMKYVEHLLSSINYIEHYNRVSTGLHSSRLRFYSNMFFDMKIGFPPQEEQNKIIEYIENISAKISKAIGLKEREIEVLKECKSSLINSAVTGKVKIG